jgi:hypothetical protein
MGAMKGNVLVLWLTLALVCRATNTTFNWTSISHTPTTSSAHRNVGDYVALGLGFDAHDTSSITAITKDVKDSVAVGSSGSTDRVHSTLASTTGHSHTQASDYSSPSQTQSNGTIITTTTAPVEISGHIHTTTNSTNATSSSDCWQTWLDYWSASSLNGASYTTSPARTWTETNTAILESITYVPTSSWESFYDVYTYTTLTTFSSDGFPVSVSTSYSADTISRVGWTVDSIRSSLGVFTSIYPTTVTYHDYTTITRSSTALPIPKCKLPALVPECKSQWSSYIHAEEYPRYGDWDGPFSSHFIGAPGCTQAMITGDWCTSMASFYFAPTTMYGQNTDPGWVSTNTTSYFPASKTLAPGCTLGCQGCSITGESVQLLYWPPATASLVEDGTETATLTPFARNDSSLRTVSFHG